MSAPPPQGAPDDDEGSAAGLLIPALSGVAALVLGLLAFFVVTGPPEIALPEMPKLPPPAQGGPGRPGGSGVGPSFGGIKFYSRPDFSGLRTEVEWRNKESELYSQSKDPGEAEWKLSYLYGSSRCPYKNEGQSHGYLETSASMGYPPALLELGKLYAEGRGVPQDPGRARSLLEEARKKGMGDAKRALDALDGQP